MAASINDLFTKVGTGAVTTLESPGKALGASSINIASATNWPTDTAVFFAMRQVDQSLVNSANPSGQKPNTFTVWKGIVSGSTINGLTLQYGNDQIYPAGVNTQVYITVSAEQMNAMVTGILNFANQNGTLKTSAVQATFATLPDGILSTRVLNNPYKFSVYRAGGASLPNAAWTKVPLNIELFDTGNNFDITTNNRFVATISGYYQFNAQVGIGAAGISTSAFAVGALYKNGAEIHVGIQIVGSGNSLTYPRSAINVLLKLNQGDYIELWAYCSESAGEVASGADITFMHGFLVSAG